jgi:hypothetical protein
MRLLSACFAPLLIAVGACGGESVAGTDEAASACQELSDMMTEPGLGADAALTRLAATSRSASVAASQDPRWDVLPTEIDKLEHQLAVVAAQRARRSGGASGGPPDASVGFVFLDTWEALGGTCDEARE